MFELEDFDLDDEIFLNTQMPSATGGSPKRSNDPNDEIFLNIPNSYESSNPQTVVPNSIINFSSITEHKSEIKNPLNKCQTKDIKLNFDDCFDSDDEVFINTPDISYEPNNSVKTHDCTSEINFNKDFNESASSFNCESSESVSNSSNIKNSNQSTYINHLNTTVTCIKTITPKCTSRKFPGPAGLLSENEDQYLEDPSNLETLDMSINITENDKKENLCTQANDASFSSSPYQQFLSDFFTTNVDILLDKYNVAWIKQKLLPYTASGRFFTDKIPFFVSVIKEIDCLSPDPTVVLVDKTGSIRGTIHREVWNQFSSLLKAGAVLVLSKVGVSCQKIVNGFTLNITSDHLISIYSFSSENMQEVIVTRTTDLTNEEVVNEARRPIAFNTETLNISQHSEIRSRFTALNNLKLHNILLDQNSQLSNVIPAQSTPVKSVFKLKSSIASNLLKINSSCNISEEPPFKRIRNEEELLVKTEENVLNHEMSIIQNIFEGIDEDEMFNDFCC